MYTCTSRRPLLTKQLQGNKDKESDSAAGVKEETSNNSSMLFVQHQNECFFIILACLIFVSHLPWQKKHLAVIIPCHTVLDCCPVKSISMDHRHPHWEGKAPPTNQLCSAVITYDLFNGRYFMGGKMYG